MSAALLAVLVAGPAGAAPPAPDTAAPPTSDPAGPRLRLLPTLGWFVPSSLLYRSDYPPARTRMRSAPVVGVGAQLQGWTFPLALRVGVERVQSFDSRMVGTIPGDGFQETLTFHHAVPTRLTFVSGELLLRSPWEPGGTRPFLVAGVGLRRYAFGEVDPPDRVGFTPPMDGTGGMLRYGAGLELRALGWTLVPQGVGAYSRYTLVDDERGTRRAHPQGELTLGIGVHLPRLPRE